MHRIANVWEQMEQIFQVEEIWVKAMYFFQFIRCTISLQRLSYSDVTYGIVIPVQLYQIR